jgi:hypothetical protein
VNFYCLSNTPVDGKQYLSEVVFSALIRFLLYTTSTDHKVKQSPKSTTGIFSITYVMLCGARDQTCGQQVIASPSRQYFSTFLAFDSDFFLAKNQTMRLIRFPALQVFLFFFSPCPKVRYFSNNENPTRALNTTSLKCCLPSTDAIDRREKIHACI